MTAQPDQQVGETPAVSTVDWAPVPRVNLLPPEILAARGFRKVQLWLLAAVVVVLALIVGCVVWAQARVGDAEARLAVTTARSAQLHRQEAQYAEVPRLSAAVESAKAARQTALDQDLLWYRLMSDIALAAPANVWLTTMNVTLMTGPGVAGGSGKPPTSTTATGADPLVPTGIGKVTVTGTAGDYPDVAAWLDALARVHGLDGATLQSATRESATGSGEQLQFSTQIVISSGALSHRYDRKAS